MSEEKTGNEVGSGMQWVGEENDLSLSALPFDPAGSDFLMDFNLGHDINVDDGNNVLLDCDDSGGLSHLSADSGVEEPSGLDVRQAFGSFFADIGSNVPQMELVECETGSECTLQFDPKFGIASGNYLTELAREGEKIVSKKMDALVELPQALRITEDDFEEEERKAYQILSLMVKDCYEERVPAERRMRSIEWVFTPIDRKITFDVCCNALRIRPHVLRTRIHYEFFLRWIKFKQFPYMTVPIPSELSGQISYYHDQVGIDIAKQAWNCPGISVGLIVSRLNSIYPDYKLELTIADMEVRGILAMRADACYLTGRNPNELGGASDIINRKQKEIGFWSTYW